MPLTRFLYMADEVIITFLETLLKREDLGACYFWISEYYFSGFELKTWDLLWKIFYDFYAIKYPKLEKYMIAQFTLWEKNRHISYILRNFQFFIILQSAKKGKKFISWSV